MHLKGGVFALALAIAVGLAGCGKKEEGVVKIGHAGPLTGSIAHLGKDNENGVRMALDEANAAGIEIGGNKVQLELLSEDDQADPKQGTIVAQKLVDARSWASSGTSTPVPPFPHPRSTMTRASRRSPRPPPTSRIPAKDSRPPSA
jgi:branched-chain amino acid transport system substrate-binding protein